MTKRYAVSPVDFTQVVEVAGPGKVDRVVWDGTTEGLGLDDGIRGAELVCRLFNLGCTELPTVELH